MKKLITLRKWLIKLAVVLAVFTPVFFAVSALGARFGMWDWRFAFGTLVRGYGTKLLFATLIVAGIALLLSVLLKPRKGWLVSVLALAVPLAGMGYGKSVSKKAGSLPFIHDITTDTQDVPTFTQVIIGQRGDKSNTLDYAGKKERSTGKLVSELQTGAYPDIQTLVLSDAPAAAFNRALATAKSMRWTIASQSPQTGIIEATAVTMWFGFKDDVVIRVRSAGNGSKVDVRSISRVGGSDIGANADRIRKFSKKLGK